MAESDLVRRAIDVNLDNLALGNEVFEADGAMFVRNTALPSIYDANFVTHVSARTGTEIDRLLARVEAEYAHAGHRSFRVDNSVAPEFEARLALGGYVPTAMLISVLEGDLIGTPRPVELREVAGDADWEVFFRLHVADWVEHAERTSIDSLEAPDVGRGMAESHRRKSPPVRNWLALDEGEARGYFSAWEGREGVGQVENLFVLKEYRHRGLATALIHRCVEDARAHGAGSVAIVSDPTDTPKHMYAAMGFRPIAVQRSWLKRLDS